MNSSQPAPYPPLESRARAVLVRNISRMATDDAIDEFFSFCGGIESKKLRAIPPRDPNTNPSLEAIVIFEDEAACQTALMMNDSILVDQPVTIISVPPSYNFNEAPAVNSNPNPNLPAQGPDNGLFGNIGGMFAGFSSAVASECKKAAQMLDNATETGVLKTAKDQVFAAQQKTKAFAAEIDDKYHVKNTLLNAAESSKTQMTTVASAVAEQTRNVASQVDGTLHISQRTNSLAERAMENPAVSTGVRSISEGWQSLLVQTGLQPSNQAQQGPSSQQPTSSSPNAPLS